MTLVHTGGMRAARWQLDRLEEDVTVLGRRGLPREQYFAEVAGRLRRVVDCDAMCWHTLDPLTRLMTSDSPQELIGAGIYTPATAPAAGAAIVASEYLREDFNTFAGLAARRVPVGVLSEVTRGRPQRSARYREVLAPSGIPFEMRAAFVTRGRCWGAVHLARREDRRDFSLEDVDALASITATVADGIRTSLRFDAARHPDDGTSPGLLILDGANNVELITAPARGLMAALRSPAVAQNEEAPPTPLIALATFARSRARGAGPQGDVVAVPSPSGWITLHASLPEGRASGQVAIVLERAAGPETTAVRLEAHGVTAREREIASLLAQGLSNGEIAATLVLSPYTVQDHIKSLFEKTGVGSRQELVARVFLDHYMPQLAQQTPLTSDGRFAAGEHAAA
jgi:DNA-binding NarL/FixJ family response regulator